MLGWDDWGELLKLDWSGLTTHKGQCETQFVGFWKAWEKLRDPVLIWVGRIVLHSISFDIVTKYQEKECASTRVHCCTKAGDILISVTSMIPLMPPLCSFVSSMQCAMAKNSFFLLNIDLALWSYHLLMMHWLTSLSLLLKPCHGNPSMIRLSANLDWKWLRSPIHSDSRRK